MNEAHPLPASPPLLDPIFILGISARSGTNYLADLLCLHPHCGLPDPFWEDFLVQHADLLVKYTNATTRYWRRWIDDEGVERLLCRYLGDGLIAFLTQRLAAKRLVAKTPSVRNLEHFFTLFPRAYLLILIRDGRAVVASAMKTFNADLDSPTRRWAEAASTILRFDEQAKDSGFKYLIVRYEDLWHDVQGTIQTILAFLGLDPQAYDFDAARNLPVRGSSVSSKDSRGKVTWQPVERTPDFDPLHRWAHWSRAEHERFNWIAGRYQRRLAYDVKSYPTFGALWTLWNVALDVKWRVRDAIRSVRDILISLRPRRVSGPAAKI